MNPLRMILVGVAVNAVFTGLTSAMGTGMGQRGHFQGASTVSRYDQYENLSDVRLLVGTRRWDWCFSLFIIRACNLLSLEDTTASALGVNVNRNRLLVSAVAVLLAAISTAVVGTIGFLGLIVPHIGRHFVGSDHKKLIPFSAPARRPDLTDRRYAGKNHRGAL